MFAAGALLPGMFCFPRGKQREDWPVVVLPLVSSSCDRNVEAGTGSGSPCAVSRCS